MVLSRYRFSVPPHQNGYVVVKPDKNTKTGNKYEQDEDDVVGLQGVFLKADAKRPYFCAGQISFGAVGKYYIDVL